MWCLCREVTLYTWHTRETTWVWDMFKVIEEKWPYTVATNFHRRQRTWVWCLFGDLTRHMPPHDKPWVWALFREVTLHTYWPTKPHECDVCSQKWSCTTPTVSRKGNHVSVRFVQEHSSGEMTLHSTYQLAQKTKPHECKVYSVKFQRSYLTLTHRWEKPY